jgi:hypothetical protein
MATYTGSPFGSISGKVGRVIGTRWKGINRIIVEFSPTNPNTIKQVGIRTCYRALCKLASRHLNEITNQIFKALVDSLKVPKTGMSYLIEKSNGILYASSGQGSQEPDWSLMRPSWGRAEETQEITSTSYSPVTGALTVNWDTRIYKTGSPNDGAVVFVFRAPYTNHPEGNSWVAGPGVSRSAGTATVYIPPNLPSADLTSFVYFADSCANYSPAEAMAVLQSRDSIYSKEDALTGVWNAYNKIQEFKIYREASKVAYKLFAAIQSCSAYFRLKSGIEGNLDSSIRTNTFPFATVKSMSLDVSSQNEYISVEVWAKKAGTGSPRIEYMSFYGYE